MAATMIEPVEMMLGGEARAFSFSPRAMRLAQKLLNGRNPRVLLATERGEDVIITCAACGLIKQMGDKADVERVSKWLDREPEKYPELERCVLEAALRYYKAIGVVQDDDTGEGDAP
jgi:hypothetical protein